LTSDKIKQHLSVVAICYNIKVKTEKVIKMAKAASPIRLQADLMQSASEAAKRFHRSTAEQVEYWADIGRQTSNLIDPDVLISIMSGLVTLKIEPIINKTIDPSAVFKSLEKDRANGHLKKQVSSSAIRYQASQTHPNYLEQIDSNGQITVGQFKNGIFTPLIESPIEQ